MSARLEKEWLIKEWNGKITVEHYRKTGLHREKDVVRTL